MTVPPSRSDILRAVQALRGKCPMDGGIVIWSVYIYVIRSLFLTGVVEVFMILLLGYFL